MSGESAVRAASAQQGEGCIEGSPLTAMLRELLAEDLDRVTASSQLTRGWPGIPIPTTMRCSFASPARSMRLPAAEKRSGADRLRLEERSFAIAECPITRDAGRIKSRSARPR